MMKILGYIRHRYLLLLAIFTAVILVIVHLNLRSYAFDDAYIHFRISSHLANYGEPYFNQGEAVMASSSTGWTILLALLARGIQILGLSVNLPVLTSLINALASAAGAYIYTLLFDRLVQKPNSWLFRILFFLTFLGLILPTSIGLMETPTVILFVGLSLHLLLNKNRWCMVCLGALPFFRPELVVVSGLAALYIIITRRFSIKEIVLFYFLGAIPFILFDLYFFKTYSLTYIGAFRYFVSKIFDDLALLSMLQNISLLQKLDYAGYAFWVITSFLIIYIYKTVRQYFLNKHVNEEVLLGLLFLLWYGSIVALYLFERVLIFSWYEPIYTIPLLFILGKTFSDIYPKKFSLALGIMLLPLLLGQLSSIVQIGMGAFIDPQYAPEYLSSARVRNYIKVGRELFEQYPDAKLMTSEIGGLGYGFYGYIYDGVGLVSPEALKFHPLNNAMAIGGIPAGFVREKKPDLIVSYDVFMQDLIHNDVLNDYLLDKYPLLLEDDLIRVGTERIYNSDALNVYVRKNFIP
jgi:hypothetical protein